jgi:hypothetical protein
MSKKLILFLMVLLFGSTSFLRADEVTIGDPTATTTNSYLPTYSLYDYSFSQQIYTADEIGMSGTINDVTLWLKNSSSYARNFNVYMKEVSEVAFEDATAWVSMTDADLVATGVLANGISDPVATTFTLSAPFSYSGNGNLVICFQDVTGSWSSGAASVVMTGNGYQALYAYRDGTPYDPTTPGVTGTRTDNKSVVRLTIEGSVPPVPPTPTGELTITPDAFELGDRPVNGWMEPFAVKINNGGDPVTITASMSNTAGVNAFAMSEEINDYVLDTDAELDFTVNINNAAPAGEYAEEFTLFSVNNRDITTVPVTATFYTAGEADIVETAKTLSLSYAGGVANFSHTPANLHANYFGYNQNTALDAVYQFTLAKDAKISVTGGTFIGIYNKVLDFHPTAAIMPVAMTYDGTLTDATLLAGQYYMIVAGHNITTVEGTVEQLPAPSELVALSPVDGATEVEAPVTLTWEGGENAAQYQVLFGTSPVSMDVVLDWTVIDENYGSYTVASLEANTQYFWQIKARNTNGTVQTERQGFTSTLTAPYNVTASEEEIFTDGTTLIKWKHNSGTISDLPETQIGSGTSTNSYFPTYNLYNYSMTEQIYTGEEIGEAGIINSISFYPVGAITRNLKIYLANTDKTSFTSGSDWVAMTEDDLVYEGNVDMVANTWVTIQLNEPFEFDGSNLLLAVTDHTGTWTSSISYYVFDAADQAINIYQDSAPYSALAPAGAGTVRAFKNQIVINKEGRSTEPTRSFIGYNVYYGDVKANTELITEREYLLGNLPYNVEPGHNVSVTAVYDEGESTLSTPVVVKVSGYGTFTGQVTELISGDPVAGVNVKFNGKDEFNNTVSFEGTTNLNGVYTINNVKAGNYRGTATLEGMEPRVSDPVELAYNTTETVNFVIHEEYKPVLSVYATEVDTTLSKVQWSLNTEISGGGGGSGATAFTEGFEGGLNGWNVLTVNADGGEWIHSSQNLGGYDYSTHAHGGTGFAMCYSFVDYVGAFNTDSYIYTPEKYSIVNGSTLTFFADNANDSYPENFSVVIATADNPTASDFTQVWSGSAKGTSDGAAMRHINNRYDNWRSHSIDLSAYAGQTVYIGFHDVNYDMYEVWIDDVELSTGSKGRAVQEYAIYRKAILKETEVTPADSVFFGTTTDTLYADFDWNNREPGLYQYGVSAHYPMPSTKGNRDGELTVYEGTQTNNHVPMYVFYFDDWTRSQFVIPAADLADVAGGTISALKFYTTSSNMPYTTVSTFDFYMKEVDYTTISAYETKESCELVYSGTGDFVTAGEGGMITITFNTPYTYNGGNLLIGCENTSDSGYKNIYFYGTTVTGASISGSNSSSTAAATVNQQNFIPQTTFVYEAGGGGGNDNPVTPITWSNILPKDMETTVTVNAVFSTGSPVGTTVLLSNTFENLEYTATLDETGSVTFEDFRKGNYVVTVEQTGYNTDYNHVEVAIWDDTTITAHITEKFEMVPDFAVSGTGFARWTNMLPEPNREAERYHLLLEGVFVDEIVDNFYQFDPEVLTVGETYTASVAVVYTTGMSDFKDATFTYIGCENVTPQIEELAATHENCEYDVILTWNGGQPTPPTPPTGDVIVKLTAGDVWGDGSGYQMLLDDTHSLYGTTIPTTGALSMNCSGNEGIYSQFSHKIPTNADGNCTTSNIVINNTVEITIPAGTYDWCITNPTPGDRIWIAAANGNVGGRYDNYVFEGGHTYEFTVSYYGGNDGVDVTITGGKGMYQPNMSALNLDVRTTGKTIASNIANAGEGFGASATNMTRDWLHYDSGTNSDAIGLTSGGGFYWGIMFPGNTYEGTRVTKIAYFDYAAHNGSFMIYQGGTSAPGTLLYTQAYNVSGTSQYIEIELDEAVEIDNTQNLWLVMHNNTGQYVAAIDETSYGVANASCISMDGSEWYNTVSAASSGQLDGNWNLRIFTETGGTPTTSIVPNKYNVFFDGEIVGATAQPTFTYVAPDREMHNYAVMWVSSNYDMSCIMDIDYAATCDGIEENDDVVNSIYPNPTSAELYINATAMKHVTVFNAMGQMVYDQDVDADNVVLHMNQYEAGVYMVNVITENGSSVKRVTVVK